MNYNINDETKQVKVLQMWLEEAEIKTLIKAGIPESEIVADGLGAWLIHPEHEPILNAHFSDHEIFIKMIGVEFEELQLETQIKSLAQKQALIKKHYPDVIHQYQYNEKRLTYLLEKKSADISSESFEAIRNTLTERINKNYDRKVLGIMIDTIPEINEKMLGLRGLICLAAAPNCGKTSLAVQLILEAVLKDEDVCGIFISLEMDPVTIYEHMYRLCADMTFRELFFRSDVDFSSNKAQADKEMDSIKNRMFIVSAENLEGANTDDVIRYARSVLKKSGCKRMFMVIDYLQIWPLPSEYDKLSTLDRDKRLMVEMKKLAHAFPQDAIMLISEARKPAKSNEQWSMDLADLSGSGRLAYAFEAVFVINGLSTKAIAAAARKHNVQLTSPQKEQEYAELMHEELERRGSVLCYVSLIKIRSGGIRFKTLMEFCYHKDRFYTANGSGNDNLFNIVQRRLFPNSFPSKST